MRTRSLSHHKIAEPLRIEFPSQEDQFQEDPLEVLMADNRTMAQLLQAPTVGKSKVRQSRAKAVVAKVNSSSSTQSISFDVAKLKDMVRALLLDKKNQSSAPAPSPTPAPNARLVELCTPKTVVVQKGMLKTKYLFLNPPKNCARCGHPVDGPYCQGCALLRKKHEEDLGTHSQDFQNTSESFDDSTNVVNAPRESFVVKQYHRSFVDKIICDLNKAPDSPHLHTFLPNQFHCFHCKDVLGDGEACQRCTCTRCGSGLSKGLCLICGNNQNSLNDSPSISANSSQNPPHIDERCYECGDALEGIFCQRCTCFDQTKTSQFPVVHPPPQETSIEISQDQENDAFGNKQYKLEDIQELFRKLLNDVQNIHEELAEYYNTPGWNHPTFYNNSDDDDEPDNSLSMEDEHLDTISATKSDEVIKSSVDDLVPIPSESEGIPDTMCDVRLINNPTPLEAKDHFEIVINSNDDYSSSDDDSLYYENIEYVEASPHDSELVSLEVEKIVILEDEDIEDDNLREKLLKVNLLIAKIEALKDNLTPSFEFLTQSSSTSPKPFLEEMNTFDDSLPEFENFCFNLEEISSGSTITHSNISLSDYKAFSFYDDHIEEISSGSTTTHSDISLSEYDSFIFDLLNDQFPPTDRSNFTHQEFADELAHIISLPEYDCFYFRNLPDPGEWISNLNFRICENLSSTTCVNLPVEDDHSPLLAYVVWIFLAYLTYPVIPSHLHSFRNEDTIFDPGITINRFFSFKPGLSHRCGTFKKFNTHRSHLNESPMETLFCTLFPMDQ
nr:hypothetical protein [Tanacetum cinerariifolium]